TRALFRGAATLITRVKGGVTLLPEQATESWTPCSELEKGAVQEQLEKLLATYLFNSSRRYPSFLRYVLARVLAGQTAQLKERILGIEIFGRPPDYDTNTDPIVRVTAAEIRKRIEHYYQDPVHSQEIRIYLPSGSYAPQFSWPGHPGGAVSPPPELHGPVTEAAVVHAPSAAVVPDVVPAQRSVWQGWRGAFSLAVLAVIMASTAIWYFTRPPVLKQFWESFVKSPEPVLFCMADQIQYSTIRLRDAADPQRETTLSDSMIAIIIDDVSPLVNVAGVLRAYGKTYRVLGESTTTLTDLRRAPSVL